MAKTREYMDYLDETIGIAPAGSQEELQAAETIADIMRDHGFDPMVEEFDARPLAGAMTHVLALLLFVCLLVTGLTTEVVHFAFLLLSILECALILFCHFGFDLFEGFGPGATSQNVVALHEAEGDRVVKGARPIVVVAHYDTPRESILWGPLSRGHSLLRRATIPCVIVAAVALLFQLLVFLPDIVRTVTWVVGLIALLPVVVASVLTIVDRHLPCTIGANDNKSSVAALLAIMDKVVPADDAAMGEGFHRRRATDVEPEPAGPQVIEIVEEVYGVRHGYDVLSSLGILPPSCEVIYEEPKVRYEEVAPAEEPSAAAEDEQTPEESSDTEGVAATAEAAGDAEAAADEAVDLDDEGDVEPIADEDEEEDEYVDEDYEEEYDEDFGEAPGRLSSVGGWFSQRFSSLRERLARNREQDEEEWEDAEEAWEDEEPEALPAGDDATDLEENYDEDYDEDYEEDVAYVEGEVEEDVDEYVGDDVDDDVDEPASVDSVSAEDAHDADLGAQDEGEAEEADGGQAAPSPVDADLDAASDADSYLDVAADEEPYDYEGGDLDEDGVAYEDEDSYLEDDEYYDGDVVDYEDADVYEGDDADEYEDDAYEEAAAPSAQSEDEWAEWDEDDLDYVDDGDYEESGEAAERPSLLERIKQFLREQFGAPVVSETDKVREGDSWAEDEWTDDYDYEEEAEDEWVDEGSDQDAEYAYDDEYLDEEEEYYDDKYDDAYEEDEYVEEGAGAQAAEGEGAYPVDQEGYVGEPEDEYVDEYESEEGYEPYEDDFEDDDLYEYEDEYEDEPIEPEPLADPNLLHFDREEDADILPRDTTGLDTISDSYDLMTPDVNGDVAVAPPTPIDDPSWGSSSFEPARPTLNIARRAALFDIPDPSQALVDPLAPEDEYEEYDEYTYEDEYEDELGDDAAQMVDQPTDPDARAGEWKGGAAVRSDLRSSDDPIVIDADDLQEAILELGDDFLVAHDIWFVATGSSASDHAGIKAFIDAHRRDVRGCFLVNLESIGAGTLGMYVREGLHAPRTADRRLVRMIRSIATDLHIPMETAVMGWDETDAATPMRSRVRAVSIVGLDDANQPALSHTPTDVPDNVNPDQVNDVVRIVCELIRRS